MKLKFLITMLFVSNFFFSQARYNNVTNHQKGNYSIEPALNIGEKNKGIGLMFGYYIADYLAIRAGATYRKFKYHSYKENILEGNIDFVFTPLTPEYDSRIFRNFNVAVLLGVAYENVKVTSKTTLIDPYPKYFYVNGGVQVEYAISDYVGVVGNFRQYYAINGSKDELGNWRYDYGLGVRFYLWGKY